MSDASDANRNRPVVYDRLSRAALRDALTKMHLIRRFEEAAEDSYIRGKSYGTMHLSIGQEATAVGVCSALTTRDYITSTHRGHGHCIAKGADAKRMFAEFLGRETGYCRGRGGSMHIADPSQGNLGANGIVGGGLPIAVGAAFSAKRLNTGAVAVAFFGDGANNEGAFHESLNLAAVWKLPAVFVCENNLYGMSVSTARSTAVTDVAARAAAYAMPGVIVDGNDFAAVAEAAFAATDRARAGEGPTLIECKTYRTRGHSRSDRNRYRTKEEIEAWRARDPIGLFETELVALGLIGRDEIAAVAAAAEREVADAVAFAEASPVPDPRGLLDNVYTPVETGR
jgi:acetoin:2,6-dichlorophenolindophenol oxidoreductase subunit alpha